MDEKTQTLQQIFEDLLRTHHTGRVLFHFRAGYPVLVEKLPRRPDGRVAVAQPK